MARAKPLSQHTLGHCVGTGSNYLTSEIWTHVDITSFIQNKHILGHSVGTGSNYLTSEIWTHVDITFFIQNKHIYTYVKE
jgi:hypothetical protein